MDGADVVAIRQRFDALRRALDEERFRHVTGVEPEPALQRIFQEHSTAAHRETVAALRDLGEADLARRIAILRAERTACEEEGAWRAAEGRAVAPGPDGAVPLAEAEELAVREKDRERRLALGRAAEAAIRLVAAPREAAVEKRARARAEMGLSPDWELVVEADDLLGASEDAYRDVLGWLARRDLGLSPTPRGDLARADLLHLLSLPASEGLFPPGMLLLAIRPLCEQLGLPFHRIRIDDNVRPAKWPGAHALGEGVSFRRSGGVQDWLGLFRAVGEAFGAQPPPHGRDDDFAPGLGALLEGLLLDPLFLGRSLGLDRKRAPDLARALALRRLFALRAHAAALRVATEAERGMSGSTWRETHRDALSRAALANWPDGLAARDADAGAHAARLAGAAWAEKVRTDLVDRFDEDYWRNPRAASAIAGLLTLGRFGPVGERPLLKLAAEAMVRRMDA